MMRVNLMKCSLILSICFAIGSLGGCARKPGGIFGVDCLADIQKGAVPEPVGTKVCQWQNAHIREAVKDETTLYQADFIGRSDALSPGAAEKMSNAVQKGLAVTQPWVIEPSGDPNLDSARVNGILRQLSRWGIQNPIVTIAKPTAIGLRGIFAESTFGNLGNQSQGNLRSTNQFNRFPN